MNEQPKFLMDNPQKFQEQYMQTINEWRKALSYFRSRPDRFLDFIRHDDCPIQLHFFQRIFLRVLFRHKRVFFTFTRGTSKSYSLLLACILKAILYPGIKIGICSPHKEQSAKIVKGTLRDIFRHFPILENEIDWRKSREQNDYVLLEFKNGSFIDVLIVSGASRGQRRHMLAIEEIADKNLDKEQLTQAVLPTVATDRVAANGKVDPNEVHKQFWAVTTAGVKQSFAFEVVQSILADMAKGNSAFYLGADYRLGGMYHLDVKDIEEKRDVLDPLGFMREYQSIWTGTTERSLVKLDDLNYCRKVLHAEDQYTETKNEKNPLYILAYDVARSEKTVAQCALCVLKLVPNGDGTYKKKQVNLYSFDGTHFDEQAKFIRKKVDDFKAHMLVVDANGMGKGLVDILIREDVDHPSYAVVNDRTYDKYRKPNSVPILYALQSNSKEDKDEIITAEFMNHISNKKVYLLVSEARARDFLIKDVKKETKDEIEQSKLLAEKVRPYVATDLLVDEIMNLEYQASGNKIKYRQISRSIPKDKFSAFAYALHYATILERENTRKKREKVDLSKFILGRKPSIF